MNNQKREKSFYRGSAAAMTEHAAALIITEAYHSIADHGRFSLVLAGGNSPRSLYRQLAYGIETGCLEHYGLRLPDGEQTEKKGEFTLMPWQQTWLFWGDERCVPPGHPESNYRMAEETLLLHSPLPVDHLFRIPAEQADAGRAAEAYETAIRSFFSIPGHPHTPENVPAFDLLLLGLGEDGHTASLFAGNIQALQESMRLAIAVDAPNGNPPGKRITITLPLINHARNVLFFTSGKAKARLAEKIYRKEECDLPASLVSPVNGRLFWFTAQP
ncbi:MAG: 6-phosphogluconolactonase [Chlorobiaceae bacterium]|nr:6-phosphogluconolactonase [Chlorobiaceae bacterium]